MAVEDDDRASDRECFVMVTENLFKFFLRWVSGWEDVRFNTQ